MRVIDGTLYGQRALFETVFSVIKRTLGDAVRARSWYREFREIVLMCASADDAACSTTPKSIEIASTPYFDMLLVWLLEEGEFMFCSL